MKENPLVLPFKPLALAVEPVLTVAQSVARERDDGVIQEVRNAAVNPVEKSLLARSANRYRDYAKETTGVTHLETRCDAGYFIEFSWSGRLMEVMPFGKQHRGRIRDLLRDYLRWLLTKADISKSLRRSIKIWTGEAGCVYPGYGS